MITTMKDNLPFLSKWNLESLGAGVRMILDHPMPVRPVIVPLSCSCVFPRAPEDTFLHSQRQLVGKDQRFFKLSTEQVFLQGGGTWFRKGTWRRKDDVLWMLESEKEPRKLSNRRGGDLFPSLPGDAVLSRCWKTQGLGVKKRVVPTCLPISAV